MMLALVQAEYLDGHRLKVRFSSGEAGVVDLTNSLWGPVFEPLRNVAYFPRFQLSPVLQTLVWDNEADFAPEYLRDRMIEQATMAHAVRQP